MPTLTADAAVRRRILSIDLLRGLVMVIMALDHVRDFFHYDAFVHDPLDPAHTGWALFFTRWITHFCAPVFVFLAGTSIYLQGLRKSRRELTGFLLKRGFWLLVVEFVVITFAWSFQPGFPRLVMQVIAAIGFSMIAMAALIHLPYRAMLGLGLLIVFGHNVFDSIPSTHQGFWWDLLRNGAFASYTFAPGHFLLIIYPIVPWLGVMLLGYAVGRLYAPDFAAPVRKRRLLQLGLGVIALFLVLRGINVYGDPSPWSVQSASWRTVLSFLDVTKYPPSLLYLCMTLGLALLFLAYAEPLTGRSAQAIIEYGRVPFFYYVLHFYLIHLTCMVLFLARGHAFSEHTPPIHGVEFRFLIPGEGYHLTVVYFIWIGVVLALYPLCRWFSQLKQRNKAWWLSYL
ncbi:MAG: DUF1624 domain-containing protein [Flavobacteriales bacterium]|nr:DUF1624 domain-containing protein [Flavobacteriales bacterium]MCB9166860.1 DUF1624 domain-containing protein [Flavobacteriales bacterium]